MPRRLFTALTIVALLTLLPQRSIAQQPAETNKIWTEADLGRRLKDQPRRTPRPEELGWLQANRFVPAPERGPGPLVVIIGDGRPTLGPWEFPAESFMPPLPLANYPGAYLQIPQFVPWTPWPAPIFTHPAEPPVRTRRPGAQN